MGKFYQYLWQHRMPGRKLNLDNGDALKQGSVDLFLINLAAPILYAHGAARGDMEKPKRGAVSNVASATGFSAPKRETYKGSYRMFFCFYV